MPCFPQRIILSFLHASLLGRARCWPATGTEKQPGGRVPAQASRGGMGCSSRLGFEGALFLLRGCEAQAQEAGGCHPGPALCLPDRGGGSPWAGPGACSSAGPPEPAARSSAQTPGCPGGLTGSLAGVFRQLAGLVPLWCVQVLRSRLCVDCPEVCREVLGTVHGSVPASQQARPRLIHSSRTEPAESSGQSRG